MAPQTAIEVESLSKRYRLGQNLGGYTTLRETLAARRRRRPLEHAYLWALRDVSFSYRRDQALGLVGPNGAREDDACSRCWRDHHSRRPAVSRTRGRAERCSTSAPASIPS
jgi:hypothetical protein